MLIEAGLRTIEEYIKVRRNTIASYIVNRPILKECEEGKRRRGTVTRQWWWEQPMGLDDLGATGHNAWTGEAVLCRGPVGAGMGFLWEARTGGN